MMFIHYGVNTFTGRQWGLGNEDPAVFAPTDLDANRWARIAREAGFKGIVLTAKHHDGFCLWPSALTDHSVAASPWRGGKGDLVLEVADACRDQGLRFGVYLSPWDRHEPTYGTPAYDDYYVGQLEELLTNYGPVAEVWLDGAIDPNLTAYAYDTARYYDTMRRLQPGAVIAVNGPDVRWVGNEDGRADETQWSPQPAGEPPVDVWYPSECDVANRLWGQWFWNPGNELWVRPAEALVEIFFTSVGRNCGLLLNLPPNPEGRFGAEDLDALTGFRRTLDRIFETDLARGAAATASGTRNGDDRSYGPDNVTDGTPDTFWAVDDGQGEAWIEVVLGAPATFDVVSLSEPVEYGQRVASHRIEVPDGNGWRTIAQGTTIGHRRLHRIDPTTADRVRLVIDDARGAPAIRAFGLYRAGTP
jgi:alpha-L-fucosidase